MAKGIKFLLALFLLPACWGLSRAVYALYAQSADGLLNAGGEAWALPAGFLLWSALFFLLPRPTRVYVLGHELTHALWALLMGGRVGKMRVSKTGGNVEVSKTNFLITLAPYFFPFYTALVLLIYALSTHWISSARSWVWCLGAVGFTWAFHLTFTLYMLTTQQSDVQQHGRLFSYVVIYGMNLLLIAGWMILIGSPRLETFFHLFVREISSAYLWVWNGGQAMLSTGAIRQ